MRTLAITVFAALWLMASCSGSRDGAGANEEIKLEQYMVQGKLLYKTNCANCHMETGEGLAKLFPPLKGSDYLLSDVKRAACIIKNGSVEEITVNGVKYNQMMPANAQLTTIEIAEILTYITNSWGNENGLSTARDVGIWLNACAQ